MLLKGKRITVIGLGREGRSLTRFLVEQGAQVMVSDAKPAVALQEGLDFIAGLPVRLSLGENRIEDIVQADLVMLSPGVFPDIPALRAARERGVPISSATKLFFQLCPAPIIGITGSSGKGTTAALLGRILQEAGRKTIVAGNIGVPPIQMLSEITPRSWVVLELSSFQLELMEESPHLAAITNIKPDHLDRHPTMKDYVQAKKTILRFQKEDDFAILNYDDPLLREMAKECPGQVVFYSIASRPPPPALFLRGDQVAACWEGRKETLFPIPQVRLIGAHNLSNALAASALALACGVVPEAIARGVSTFTGLEHRLELVVEAGGVRYYNDSIATSPSRSLAALNSFSQPIVLIAGGRDKNLPLEEWAQVAMLRCHTILLYGEAASRLEAALKSGATGHKPLLIRCSSFQESVERAREEAKPGDVVLLSPACTSFDLFQDFEERGRVFKSLVRRLTEVASIHG